MQAPALQGPHGSRAGMDICGCSSGVERNLAKVEVEGSNPFTRSSPGTFPHVASFLDALFALTGFVLAVTFHGRWQQPAAMDE